MIMPRPMSLKDKLVMAGVVVVGIGILAAGILSLSRSRSTDRGSPARGPRSARADAVDRPVRPQDARPMIAPDGRGGSISGTVVDARGSEAGEVEVSAYTFDGAARLAARVYTADDGLFLLSGLPPGLYSVEARKEGAGVAVRHRIFVEPDFVTPIFTLRLARGAKIDVRTTPGANVRIDGMHAKTDRTEYARTLREKVADGEGRATIDGLADGTYWAVISCDGFVTEAVKFFVRDGADATVERKLRKR